MPARRVRAALPVTILLTVTLTPAPSVIADNHPGYSAFQRCVVCHQADGQGIPGAFPPLKGHIARIAAVDEGRAYLVAVLRTGLAGPVRVDGVFYAGVMPAQVTNDDSRLLSQLLNYTVEVIDADAGVDNWVPFTEQEVTQLLDADIPDSLQDVARLRQMLGSQYPELFQVQE